MVRIVFKKVTKGGDGILEPALLMVFECRSILRIDVPQRRLPSASTPLSGTLFSSRGTIEIHEQIAVMIVLEAVGYGSVL